MFSDTYEDLTPERLEAIIDDFAAGRPVKPGTQIEQIDAVRAAFPADRPVSVRASGTDEAVRLTTPVKLSLEQSIAYIDDDELVEVTPKNIRMRKRFLDSNDRKRQSRSGQ